MVRLMLSPRRTERNKTLDRLTPREVDVLRLAADGLINAHIAEQLSISPETVRTHLRHTYVKLGAHNRMQAVNLARDARYLR
jgi:DNA-binding NarL/FixJ family response regulator